MLPEFHFILPVWGQLYVEMFLKVTLPCQLSPDNLGFFKQTFGDHKYKIFTMSEHVAAIQNSESYKTLSSLIETEIRTFDDLVDKSKIKYEIMSVCHGIGFREACSRDGNVYVVTLVSDSLVSNGSFRRFYELALEGKKAIVIGNFRVSTSILPELIGRFYSESEHSITVSPRELMELSVAAVHQNSKTYFWDSSSFGCGWPAYLYWSVGGEGIIMRGLHLHPIAICPARREEVFDFSSGMAIDGSDFVERAVHDMNDVYISSDSDEIAIPTLDYMESFVSSQPPVSKSVRVLSVALWMKKYCCGYAAHYLRTKIRLHGTDISPKWKEVEKESDEIVEAILRCLDFLNGLPQNMLTDLENEVGRMQNPVKPESGNDKENAFRDVETMIRKGERLIGEGNIAGAYDILSGMLDKFDKLRGVTINNLAVLHVHEGRLKTAEYLLNYMQREGCWNDIYAANLEFIKALMEKNPDAVKQ